MGIRIHVLGIALLCLSGARPAGAQLADDSTARRTGFYASLGFGWGVCGSECTSASSAEFARSGYAALGGTLNPHVRAGVELDWMQPIDAAPFLIMFAYYPSLKHDLFVKVGVGAAFASGDGASGAIGLGYDWLVGDGTFALIPFATYLTQFNGSGSGFLFGIGFGQRH